MSTQTSIDSTVASLVKASIPFLTSHGEELTRCFYQRLFRENPEVLAFFNQSHQHSGHQQRALASAICAYAAHIDHPENLSSAVAQISQKHVSLGIQPEHYPVVGKHLLAAIQELLGEKATPELLAAWGKAYQFLAQVFIGVEAGQYSRHESIHNGWKGRRTFKIQNKVSESSEIASFYLEPEDNKGLPNFLPGQYITLFPSEKNPARAPRNYSLSHKPGKKSFRISVKKLKALSALEPPGVVSSFLHEHIGVGDKVELGPPCGVFHLDPAKTAGKVVVLLSAGVGQTPLISMLHALSENKQAKQIVYVHVARNGEYHAFRDEVNSIQQDWPSLVVRYLYTKPNPTDLKSRNFFDAEQLTQAAWKEALSHAEAEYYFCGPKRFMRHVRSLLRQQQVPEQQQHFEFFGPLEDLDAAQ